MDYSINSNGHDRKDFKFINTLRDNFSTPHITQPTKKRGTDNPSTLVITI